MIITDIIIAKIMIETEVPVEREINYKRDSDPSPQCTQIGSKMNLHNEIIISLPVNPQEIFISGFLLRNLKFWKTHRVPKEGSCSQNLCKKSARTFSTF